MEPLLQNVLVDVVLEEADMEQKPQWRAPKYKAAGNLEGKVALMTGG